MKFKRLWSCVLALAMMTTMVSFQASAYEGSTNDGGYTIDEPYEYPVVPGTEEWVALDTFEEKLELSQIPDEILQEMTTAALIKTVMDYPLAASLFAHDTPDDPLRSYNVVKGEFNGLAELDQRLNENPEEVFENLLLVLGNMPVVLNEETEDFDSLYATKLLAAFSDIEPAVANRYSTEYLPTGDPDITVEAYYNLTWSAHGLTASQANAINQEYLEEYPSATLIRSAAPQYNCHSYAWYSTSASNRYWINDPSNYVNAGDYSSTDTARVGYIILYGKINRQPEHSGLVTSVSGGIANRVESKWGCLGLFEHDYDDCPYSTGTIRYYR